MNLTSIRTAIGIGAVALTLAGGLAPGLADAKGDKGDEARTERAAADGRAGLTLPSCSGELPTIFLQTSQNGQTVKGTPGRDVVWGTNGNDVYDPNGGDDVVCLRGGDDQLRGSAGDVEGLGGTGSDFLAGGSGDDFLSGEDGNDAVHGGSGNDSCHGGRDVDSFVDPISFGGCETFTGIP